MPTNGLHISVVHVVRKSSPSSRSCRISTCSFSVLQLEISPWPVRGPALVLGERPAEPHPRSFRHRRTVSYSTFRDNLTLDVVKVLPSCTLWRVHERMQSCTLSVLAQSSRGTSLVSLVWLTVWSNWSDQSSQTHPIPSWYVQVLIASSRCWAVSFGQLTWSRCIVDGLVCMTRATHAVDPCFPCFPWGLASRFQSRGEEICLGSGWHCWCRGGSDSCDDTQTVPHTMRCECCDKLCAMYQVMEEAPVLDASKLEKSVCLSVSQRQKLQQTWTKMDIADFKNIHWIQSGYTALFEIGSIWLTKPL